MTDVTNSFFNCCIKYNFHNLDLGKTSVNCNANAFFFKRNHFIFPRQGKRYLRVGEFVTLIFKIITHIAATIIVLNNNIVVKFFYVIDVYEINHIRFFNHIHLFHGNI